jgi:glycerol-3-phosphate dehydrogenase
MTNSVKGLNDLIRSHQPARKLFAPTQICCILFTMDYDLCVIGGGINGVGIARDAAGRGLSVLLVEAQDLASATSSASTKLIHGGLRYLEHYEFKLVRESLKEREILLKAAPHIIWPMRFVLPHNQKLRPYWMIKAGLKLYDFLGGKKSLPKSQSLDFGSTAIADPLSDAYKRGFAYSDCWVEDSRLVVLNAMDAFERGATIMPRTACVFMEPAPNKDGWSVTLQNTLNGDQFQIKAGMVVNAAGPWVRNLLESCNIATDAANDYTPRVRLVKGSHIILPKLYEGDQSFILQQPDGRIVFTIPYEKKFTLVGTTDVPFENDAAVVQISNEEITYLCDAVNRSFKTITTPANLVSHYSGVRSLVDDGNANASKVTRDYKLYTDERYGPPILSVFGGKITTYRHLAEDVVNRVATFHPKKFLPAWTDNATLPGGDLPDKDFDKFLKSLSDRYTFMPDDLLRRYARAYGTRMSVIMEGVNKMSDLGTHYGDNMYEAEILYLLNYEFAHTADDILWRRSKCGLHISEITVSAMTKALPALHQKLKDTGKCYENASGY